jgi:riboflavin kinase/FMN adenylyltransferase
MHIFRDLMAVHLSGPSVLTIGTFDGLHLGHQHLMNQLTAAAQVHQAQSAVISFHPRPKTVLAPHLPNNDYLTTPEERISLFEATGIDVLILLPFTLALAQTTAYDFMKLLADRLKLVEFWAGHDFALGKNREGNVTKLAELGRELNYTLRQFQPFYIDGQIVSSTGVRQAITSGEIAEASRLLGRYPSLQGQIVKGDQRGRTIGFPTANFALPPERLIPANGVYATFVERLQTGQRYPSVTNVGLRPSFEGKTRTVESYIFDFSEEIYGETLRLEFVKRLRAEKKFNGIEELVAQIRQDADQAQGILAAEAVKASL